jgi:hypothetical protein
LHQQCNSQKRLIYFHAETLRNLHSEWLQDIHRSGNALGVIDAPISELTSKLDIVTRLEDYRSEYSMGRIGLSVVQLLDSEQDEGYHHFSDFVSDFVETHIAVQKAFIQDIHLADFSSQNTYSNPLSNAPLGTNQWTDSYGTLVGHTYFSSESDGITWYFGNGFSAYNYVPYWISVRVTTYNNCGWFHEISDRDRASYNTQVVHAESLLVGSSQCPGQNQVSHYLSGTHEVQRFYWNPTKLGGYTSEYQVVSTGP